MTGEISHPVEQELLEQLLSQKETLQNNPRAILDKIDEFGQKQHIMNVGPQKGGYLIDELRKAQPEVIFEFGTHTGYSSILMAIELERQGSDTARVHTFDIDPVFFKISSQVIALAGLTHRIVQHFGKAGDIVEQVTRSLSLEHVDLVFLDHAKDCYVSDLRVLESLGLIGKGTVLCADNVIKPGAPEYLEYVRHPPIWKRDYNQKVQNKSGKQYTGKWGLIYESTIHKATTVSGHVDGLEVTTCVGVLDS